MNSLRLGQLMWSWADRVCTVTRHREAIWPGLIDDWNRKSTDKKVQDNRSCGDLEYLPLHSVNSIWRAW
eukprot:3463043-Amphidinium_carterae.1